MFNPLLQQRKPVPLPFNNPYNMNFHRPQTDLPITVCVRLYVVLLTVINVFLTGSSVC